MQCLIQMIHWLLGCCTKYEDGGYGAVSGEVDLEIAGFVLATLLGSCPTQQYYVFILLI